MEPRAKSALLWGLIGALIFLVLVQGYRLVAGVSIGLPLAVAVAMLVVAIGTAVGSYLLDGFFAGRKERA